MNWRVLGKWFLKFLSLHHFISHMRGITITMINSCLVVWLGNSEMMETKHEDQDFVGCICSINIRA